MSAILSAGTPAPDFTLHVHTDQTLSLSEPAGPPRGPRVLSSCRLESRPLRRHDGTVQRLLPGFRNSMPSWWAFRRRRMVP